MELMLNCLTVFLSVNEIIFGVVRWVVNGRSYRLERSR